MIVDSCIAMTWYLYSQFIQKYPLEAKHSIKIDRKCKSIKEVDSITGFSNKDIQIKSIRNNVIALSSGVCNDGLIEQKNYGLHPSSRTKKKCYLCSTSHGIAKFFYSTFKKSTRPNLYIDKIKFQSTSRVSNVRTR